MVKEKRKEKGKRQAGRQAGEAVSGCAELTGRTGIAARQLRHPAQPESMGEPPKKKSTAKRNTTNPTRRGGEPEEGPGSQRRHDTPFDPVVEVEELTHQCRRQSECVLDLSYSCAC